MKATRLCRPQPIRGPVAAVTTQADIILKRTGPNITGSSMEFRLKARDSFGRKVWFRNTPKQWQEASDFILSDLSQRIIKRNLFRVEVQDHPFEESAVVRLQEQWAKHYNSEEIAQAYVFTGHVSNQTYSSNKHPVLLQNASNETLPIHQHPSFSALMKYTNSQTLYYLCSPKS